MQSPVDEMFGRFSKRKNGNEYKQKDDTHMPLAPGP